MTRTFQDAQATRERVPLLVGLVGPSSSGKTYSALRLATGIQRVCGGDVGYIDTEARRALHYADRFKFRHLPFPSPFGSLDYLAAIEHFTKKGARTVVVDSMSHEHEGPGGHLEMHAAEVERLVKAWRSTPDKVKFAAWQKPKMERRRLLNTMLQMPVNFILCFRAKEKLKLITGKDPVQLGWMPIAGEEFVFEMTLNCLLYPGSGGIPSWHPAEAGEKSMVKLPEQFKALFAQTRPLSEETGEALARWAEGGSEPAAPPDEHSTLLADIQASLGAAHQGNTDAAKEARAEAMQAAFGVRGWKAVTGLPTDRLRAGLDALQRPAGQKSLDQQLAEEAAEREAREAAEFEAAEAVAGR